MSETVTPPPAAPAQTEMVLGGTVPANGAAGTQTPAPATTVGAAPAVTPAVEAKPGDKPAEKPAEKTPEALAVEKKAADEKTALEAKAADEKVWGEFKPKRAEGITSDEASLKEFIPLARELGLKPEQAQKLIELNDKFAVASAKAQQAASDKFFADQRAEFLKQTAADKDYGGKNDQALVAANKAFAKFVGQDGLKALRERHPNIETDPVLFKAFFRIGQALKDDSVAGTIGGGATKPSTQDQLNSMYPSMAKR